MQKQDAWARYWQGGALTSFGDRFASGYQGELRALWEAFFDELPAGAQIVDLGAGNGALEEIAQKYCAEKDKRLMVHAIDLAPMLPARFKGADDAGAPCRISWHPGTRNEATGLHDRSVDAVIGNYAFEYGNDGETIEEIARILKPNGRCRFLMHHRDSNIILNAGVELKVLDAELEKGGFIDTVRDYLREFGNIRKPGQFEKLKKSGKAEPLRRRMNDAHQKALQHATMQNSVLLIRQIMQWTGKLVAPPMFFEPKQVLLERLKDVRGELEANRSRLRDMQAAAVDDARLAAILHAFQEKGMSGERKPFHVKDEEVVVGWQVDVRY